MKIQHPILISGLVIGGVILVATGKSPFAVLVAALFCYAIFRIGWMLLGGLSRPVPAPPPPGELRKVKITYRCSLCGTEVRMTVSPHQDPDPPRHCQEDMDLVTPIDEL